MRVLPILDELRRNPRTMSELDALDLPFLIEMLTARTHPWRFPEHKYVWGEYGLDSFLPELVAGFVATAAGVFLGLMLERNVEVKRAERAAQQIQDQRATEVQRRFAALRKSSWRI